MTKPKYDRSNPLCYTFICWRALALSAVIALSLAINTTAQPLDNSTRSDEDSASYRASASAPISIEADAAEQDEKKGITTYRGNVAIVQGPLSIKAERVQIISRNDGEKRSVEKISAGGSPAIFTHQALNVADNISAEAENIEYHLNQGRVLFENKASLVQQGSSVTGDQIEYFIAEKRVKAQAGSEDQRGQKGRVRTVITPGSGILFGADD